MCIYANKQDLPGALSIEDIIQELDLKDETTNSKPDALIHVQACSCKGANDGDGL